MSRIQLPDDERAAAVRQRIDRSFRIVRPYLESPQTNIKGALIVDRSLWLEQVAVVAASGDYATKCQLMKSIFDQRIDDCSRIAEQTLCHVIYLELAYLIQFVERDMCFAPTNDGTIVGHVDSTAPQNGLKIGFSHRINRQP